MPRTTCLILAAMLPRALWASLLRAKLPTESQFQVRQEAFVAQRPARPLVPTQKLPVLRRHLLPKEPLPPALPHHVEKRPYTDQTIVLPGHVRRRAASALDNSAWCPRISDFEAQSCSRPRQGGEYHWAAGGYSMVTVKILVPCTRSPAASTLRHSTEIGHSPNGVALATVAS